MKLPLLQSVGQEKPNLVSLLFSLLWVGLSKSFTPFKILQIPILFHWSFFICPFGFLGWVAWRDFHQLIFAASFVILCWLSLLVHEFAHILVAKSRGFVTSKVIFLPIGVVALLDDSPVGAAELRVASAGPLVSFLVSGMLWSLLWILDHRVHFFSLRYIHSFWWEWLSQIMRIMRYGMLFNLIIGLFNLIPIYPLDGGRLVRAMAHMVICNHFRPSRIMLAATRIAVRWIGLPTLAFAFFLLIRGPLHWNHLLILSLAFLFGELEYRKLRAASADNKLSYSVRDILRLQKNTRCKPH